MTGDFGDASNELFWIGVYDGLLQYLDGCRCLLGRNCCWRGDVWTSTSTGTAISPQKKTLPEREPQIALRRTDGSLGF